MIVRCRTQKGRWKRFKNVKKVSRVKWSSQISITGECPCCGREYKKTLLVDTWVIEENPNPQEEGDPFDQN